MGRYINPPALVAHVGTPLLETQSYAQARQQAGDRLLVVVQNVGPFTTAAVITTPDDWNDQTALAQEGQGITTVHGAPVPIAETVPVSGFTAYIVDADALAAAGGRW